MLELYLVDNFENVVFENDAFFDSAVLHGKIKMTKSNKQILKDIDGFRYTEGYKGLSKYGNYEIPIFSVSTGCKTYLNIVNDKNNIFYIGCCGRNVLDLIFELDNGKIAIDRLFLPPVFDKDMLIYYNSDKRLVHNEMELCKIIECIWG